MISLQVNGPKYATRFCEVAINILGLDFYDADIEVNFNQDLGSHYLGCCDGEFDWIEISINKTLKNKKEKLITLAHEFIHAHQILSGDLILSENSGVHLWKTQQYEQSDICPWELEAEFLERILYEEIIDEINKS